MNAEPLSARDLADMHEEAAGGWQCCGDWPRLLAHIDAQAERIAEMELSLRISRETNRSLSKSWAEQVERIRVLTEALNFVKEQAGTEAKPDDVFVASISWDTWGKILDRVGAALDGEPK